MGGRSPEHEVSVISGTEVVNNLDTDKYEILPVLISKDGSKWKLTDKESLKLLHNPLSLRGTGTEIVLRESKALDGINSISGGKADLVFIAMHGPYGGRWNRAGNA